MVLRQLLTHPTSFQNLLEDAELDFEPAKTIPALVVSVRQIRSVVGASARNPPHVSSTSANIPDRDNTARRADDTFANQLPIAAYAFAIRGAHRDQATRRTGTSAPRLRTVAHSMRPSGRLPPRGRERTRPCSSTAPTHDCRPGRNRPSTPASRCRECDTPRSPARTVSPAPPTPEKHRPGVNVPAYGPGPTRPTGHRQRVRSAVAIRVRETSSTGRFRPV